MATHDIFIPADLAHVAKRQAQHALAEAQHQVWLLRRTKGTAHADYVKACETLREALAYRCLFDQPARPERSVYERIPLASSLS